MRKELEQRIVERLPTWFDVKGNIHRTLMPLGFAHGDGWFDPLWQLCEQLEPAVAAAQADMKGRFQVLQVKEEFGELRIYPNYSNDAIAALIGSAEYESTRTCEVYGRLGKRPGSIWVVAR